MQLEFLKNIVSSIAGDRLKGIVEVLYGKKKVDENLIAKKLKININQARNLLYKLVDEGIVSFTKKKDEKKGGWFKYSWSLDEEKILIKAKAILQKNNEELRNQIKKKQETKHYVCPNGDLELDEENALLNNYTCTECGEILSLKDTNKEINSINKEIQKNEAIIQNIEQELQKINSKKEKEKEKEKKEKTKKIKKKSSGAKKK